MKPGIRVLHAVRRPAEQECGTCVAEVMTINNFKTALLADTLENSERRYVDRTALLMVLEFLGLGMLCTAWLS